MKDKRIGHCLLSFTRNLKDKAKFFCVRVLSSRERPRQDFCVNNNWLYFANTPLFPVTMIEPGRDAFSPSINPNQIVLVCEGLKEIQKIFEERGIEYRVGRPPRLNKTQLFIYDSTGVRIELNFEEK